MSWLRRSSSAPRRRRASVGDLHESFYRVANSASEEVPPPPEGFSRADGRCADCRHRVTWIVGPGLPAERMIGQVVVCGYCALARVRAQDRPESRVA